MNLFDHYMGRQSYGPSMGDDDNPMRPKPWLQPGFQAHTGGPGQMQGYDSSGINTGGGLPAMAAGFPSAQTGGGLPPMQGGFNAGTGGYDAPHAAFNANTGGGMAPQPMGLQANTGGGMQPMPTGLQAHTGGGFQPRQFQGGNGLARMFRGFSPYGRPYMR
jgi:hypothetical protein